jgi:hypothetical protein
MKLCFYITIMLLSCVCLNGEEIEFYEKLGLHQLLSPEDECVLTIKPALPQDFIAMGKSGKIDYRDWVYWGPEKVLESFFKNQKSLSTPIIRVKIAENIKQKKFGSLEELDIIDKFNKNAEFDITSTKINEKILWIGSWGSYPIYLINKYGLGRYMQMGYVGLNHESGTVLLFELIFQRATDTKDLDLKMTLATKLWTTFFWETKEKVEPSYKVLGREMYSGYTNMEICGHEIKLIAEKRKSDQKLQFAFIPKNRNIDFDLHMYFVDKMSSDIRRKEPVFIVFGTYKIYGNERAFSTFTVTLIKEVDEFTKVSNLKKNIFEFDDLFAPVKHAS